MQHLLIRCSLSFLCLAVVRAPAAFGQPAPPPASVPMVAWLNLNFDLRGGVQASLELPFLPPDPALWRQALGTTLHASLDGVGEEMTRRSWSLQAHAKAVLRRSAWTVEGDIDLTSLLTLLKLFSVGQLYVYVEHPIAEFSDCTLYDASRWIDFLETRYHAEVSIGQPPSPPPVHLKFGFPAENSWRFLPLATLLLVPIGLTLWRRSRGRRGGSLRGLVSLCAFSQTTDFGDLDRLDFGRGLAGGHPFGCCTPYSCRWYFCRVFFVLNSISRPAWTPPLCLSPAIPKR